MQVDQSLIDADWVHPNNNILSALKHIQVTREAVFNWFTYEANTFDYKFDFSSLEQANIIKLYIYMKRKDIIIIFSIPLKKQQEYLQIKLSDSKPPDHDDWERKPAFAAPREQHVLNQWMRYGEQNRPCVGCEMLCRLNKLLQ